MGKNVTTEETPPGLENPTNGSTSFLFKEDYIQTKLMYSVSIFARLTEGPLDQPEARLIMKPWLKNEFDESRVTRKMNHRSSSINGSLK